MGFKDQLLKFNKAKVNIKKGKEVVKEDKPEPKLKDYNRTDTEDYKQGWMDGDALLHHFSLFMACAIVKFSGMCRKVKGSSHLRLYRYCEGLNDRILKRAKSKKLEIKDGWIDNDSIGKI